MVLLKGRCRITPVLALERAHLVDSAEAVDFGAFSRRIVEQVGGTQERLRSRPALPSRTLNAPGWKGKNAGWSAWNPLTHSELRSRREVIVARRFRLPISGAEDTPEGRIADDRLVNSALRAGCYVTGF